MDRDERELVGLCLQGDQDACAALVQEYAQMVGTVIWRVTGEHGGVEDLAQETFLRVFRGLRYFDARAKLSTWIYTIAHRVAIDHLRQVGLRADTTNVTNASNVVSGFSRTIVAPEPDPEKMAAQSELDRIVRCELEALPDKYRIPLVYAAIDELDYKTIGAMLKVRPGSVKTLVFRARQLLRERVELALTHRSEGAHGA